jgi:hypothetical protein
MLTESYIIRIYRRDTGDGDADREVVGYLENPLTGHRYAFHGVEELLRLLAQRLDCARSTHSARDNEP